MLLKICFAVHHFDAEGREVLEIRGNRVNLTIEADVCAEVAYLVLGVMPSGNRTWVEQVVENNYQVYRLDTVCHGRWKCQNKGIHVHS